MTSIKLFIITGVTALCSIGCDRSSSCNSEVQNLNPLPYTKTIASPQPNTTFRIWVTGGQGSSQDSTVYPPPIDYVEDYSSRSSVEQNVSDDCPVNGDSTTNDETLETSVPPTVGRPASSSEDTSGYGSSDAGSSAPSTGSSTAPYYGDPYPTNPRAGTLTAGSFNDALNYSYFLQYWKSAEQQISDTFSRQPLPQFQWPDIQPSQIGQRLGDAPKTTIDLVFVLDATGSMADELAYLKREIEYISLSVRANFPNVTQRFSLIVYRDQGDQYISKGNYFTQDLPAFIQFISAQSASGGGDYPEAMHIPLQEAVSKLSWGPQSAAKIMFLIADAPPHLQDINSTLNAVDDLKKLGVHIYPVAASGVADTSERVMRYSALVTGGEYLFITDDSGVGNSHAEPHIPCYTVSHLNDLMILKISEEISQTSMSLTSDKIIRSFGSETASGVCSVPTQLQDQAPPDSN